MARRPRPPEEILTCKDLAELQHRLSMMSVTAVQDFYQYTHSARRISRPLPECQSHPGARPGMETDEEVAMSGGNSKTGLVRRMGMNCAASLRRELSQRAERYARAHALPAREFPVLHLYSDPSQSKLASPLAEGPFARAQVTATPRVRSLAGARCLY